MNLLRKLTLPSATVIITITIYTALIVFARWRLSITLDTMIFIWGILIGLILLDMFELFFADTGLFRSVAGEAVFVVLSLFVITSSTSMLGSGVVLAYLVRLLTEQGRELFTTRKLVSWTAEIKVSDPVSFGYIVFIGGFAAFLLETLLFIF